VRLTESIPPGEENKFVLLIKDDNDIYSEHKCFGWVDAGPGSFLDVNDQPEFNQLPSKIENFMGRNEVMHDLITLTLNSRFVTLKGIAGIGKSSLVKETVRYIFERKHFRNGVIYINLNGCETREAVTSCLNARIFRNTQHIESRKENGGKMVQQIIELLRTKEVLIVFDNVMDMMLVNDKEKFQLFIDLLLSNCNDIKIVITSRTSLGDGPLADYAEKIINLGPLSDEDSKNLLLARAPRPINDEEIEELLNMEIKGGGSVERKKEFVGHAFFELFGGHPQAITLAASLLDEKRLKEVFLHLKENSVINAYDYGSEISERDKKSFNSLRCSLDISWDSLMKKNENAGKLLAFFGLFPAGIQEEELARLWEKGFKEECEVLLRSSFLRKTVKDDTIHYSLFPFMAKYAEEHLNSKEKRQYHEKILEYFSKTIEEFYRIIGTISKGAEKGLNSLIRYELNIRACIFREIAYQGNEDLEKSLYDSFNLNTSTIIIKERFKDIEAIKEDDEEEFFPLTKTNIEMHQKRYDIHKSFKQNPSLSGNSLRSSSPIYITETMANQLKTPRSKIVDHFSLSQSDNYMFKAFNFTNQIGIASASLEHRNNGEFNNNLLRYSITPEPENTDPFAKIQQYSKTEVSLNTEQLVRFEKEIPAKETPKFNNDDQENLDCLLESPQIIDEKPKKIVLFENSCLEKSLSLKIPVPLKTSSHDGTTRISQNLSQNISQNSSTLNISQEFLHNYKGNHKEFSLKEPRYRDRSGTLKKSTSCPPKPGQVLPINRLIIYYTSILFLLRRYGEAIKMLKYGLRIATSNNDILAEANYFRILGVISHLRKQYGKSLDDFSRAKELFEKSGCSIGIAICEAAMGYIKFSENCELFQAKEHLEKSLRIYENLEHSFGIHFLNRWLGILKQKIPHMKGQTKIHYQIAEKIKEIKKDECHISVHKGGFFVLRWMGDHISLFLETPLIVKVFQKKIFGNNGISKNKKSGEISDSEIEGFSKKIQVKLDNSIDLENNSSELDDNSNIHPIKINNLMQETQDFLYVNTDKTKNRKPPHPPIQKTNKITTRKDFPLQ